MAQINSITAKQIIQSSVEKVAQLRQWAADTPNLAQAVSDIKAFQAKRFTGTYFDLLHIPQYQLATQFFLEELYSEKDYSQRDAQFSRIAGTLERLFPKQVVQTAMSLAQLHSLTEDLDLAMAQSWLNASNNTDQINRYIQAWHDVGRRADRDAQLSGALRVGQELVTLTRTPGLRMALKMMRKPATLAGMSALQHFLESGFDAFAAMSPNKLSKSLQPSASTEGTAYFLETVKKREGALIDQLFDAPEQICKAEIERALSKMT
jgi:hypothetical protein